MCNFFWMSPANQGDLLDIVRALEQLLPHHQCFQYFNTIMLSEEEELLQDRLYFGDTIMLKCTAVAAAAGARQWGIRLILESNSGCAIVSVSMMHMCLRSAAHPEAKGLPIPQRSTHIRGLSHSCALLASSRGKMRSHTGQTDWTWLWLLSLMPCNSAKVCIIFFKRTLYHITSTLHDHYLVYYNLH
jgi:hypothetical protein